MTQQEMYDKVLEIFPDALFDEVGQTGEVTIATGMRFDPSDYLIKI